MTGVRSEWSSLAPARHARVDQPRVPLKRHFRSEAEPLHYARAKSLDQHVGFFDQFEGGGRRGRRFQVEGYGATSAAGNIDGLATATRPKILWGRRSIDPENVGAHIREQHRAEGGWTDGLEFEDANSGQDAQFCSDRLVRVRLRENYT
jgi:hypothetical protein